MPTRLPARSGRRTRSLTARSFRLQPIPNAQPPRFVVLRPADKALNPRPLAGACPSAQRAGPSWRKHGLGLGRSSGLGLPNPRRHGRLAVGAHAANLGVAAGIDAILDEGLCLGRATKRSSHAWVSTFGQAGRCACAWNAWEGAWVNLTKPSRALEAPARCRMHHRPRATEHVLCVFLDATSQHVGGLGRNANRAAWHWRPRAEAPFFAPSASTRSCSNCGQPRPRLTRWRRAGRDDRNGGFLLGG